MSLFVDGCDLSEVLTAIVFLSWRMFVGVFRSQCSGMFGRIKSRYWLVSTSVFSRCTHAIEALFFLHLELSVKGFEPRLRRPKVGPPKLPERSTVDLPAVAVPSHPHITLTIYSHGRRRPPSISRR